MHRLSDSLLQLLRGTGSDAGDTQPLATDQLIYRLLSVMSNRPVSRHWMLSRSDMSAGEIDSLLRQLQEADALEVIDPSRFPPRP